MSYIQVIETKGGNQLQYRRSARNNVPKFAEATKDFIKQSLPQFFNPDGTLKPNAPKQMTINVNVQFQ
jgi:hypothetical protein